MESQGSAQGSAPEAPKETPAINSLDHEADMFQKWAENNPDLIPEEFAGNASNFADAWKHLRADYTRKTQELSSLKKSGMDTGKPTNKAEGQEGKEESGKLEIPVKKEEAKPEESGKVDWSKIMSTDLSQGLDEDTSKILVEGLGIPEELLGKVMAGQQALQREQRKVAAELVGGEHVLEAAVQYAVEHYSPEEINDMNQQLMGPNWKRSLLGLVAEAQQAVGSTKEPGHVQTAGGGPVNARPFENNKEISAAINDPRYNQDSTYRKQVEERLKITQSTQGLRVDKRR